jgi:hypothetical protein
MLSGISPVTRKNRSITTLVNLVLAVAGVACLGGLAGCALRVGPATSPSARPAAAAAGAQPAAGPAAEVASPALLTSPAADLPPSATPGPGPAATTTPPGANDTEAVAASPPPVPSPYAMANAEVHREVKRVACTVAETLTTYDADSTLPGLTASLTSDPGRRSLLEQAARPLHHAGWWSRGRVLYPQMGGLLADRASVMVVVEQTAGPGDEPRLVETRTLDVRLVRVAGSWTFDGLSSAGGEPIARPPDLSAAARAVLDDPRIELPDSASWDIYQGTISPSLLRLMADMADRSSYGVVVLRTGHPTHVFGTSRVSQHSVGQAVDLYRVGRPLVVDERGAGSATQGLARWLCGRAELGQIGSPWVLADGGSRSFTDRVHQDHLHIAVRY